MSIEKLQAHYGFTRMPFRRDLAPGMLHRHAAHAEAAARISWCISEHALGVITGEVGAGKTVALRGALASLDSSRHTLIYLGNPSVGVRGINHAIVAALGGVPRTHHATLTPQAMDLLAREHAERGRVPVLAIDLCRARDYADTRWQCPVKRLVGRASAGWRWRVCRHSHHRLSRKARTASGGR